MNPRTGYCSTWNFERKFVGKDFFFKKIYGVKSSIFGKGGGMAFEAYPLQTSFRRESCDFSTLKEGPPLEASLC